jgi:hypothetical protein
VTLDSSIILGPPKTQVKEIFDKLGWGKVIEDASNNNNEIQAFIYLTDNAVRDLGSFHIKFYNNIIGSGYGSTKKTAMNHAYVNALNTLTENGITNEWINKRKIAVDMDNSILSPLIMQTKIKMEKQGYIDFSFDKVKTTSKGSKMQLIGITSDQRKDVLAQTADHVSLFEGKKQLMESYLK